MDGSIIVGKGWLEASRTAEEKRGINSLVSDCHSCSCSTHWQLGVVWAGVQCLRCTFGVLTEEPSGIRGLQDSCKTYRLPDPAGSATYPVLGVGGIRGLLRKLHDKNRQVNDAVTNYCRKNVPVGWISLPCDSGICSSPASGTDVGKCSGGLSR